MNNTLDTTAPVAVEEKPARRRGASLFAGAAVALSLLAGATAALFTDSEWLGTASEAGIGVATDRFNIKISDVTSDAEPNDNDGVYGFKTDKVSWYTFVDTGRAAYTPDGYWEYMLNVQAPLAFAGTTELHPGWSTTVYVMLQNDSSVPATLSFGLVDAGASGTSTNPIFQNLSWSIDMRYANIATGSADSTEFEYFSSFEPAVTNTFSTQQSNNGNLELKAGVSTLPKGGIVLAKVTITFNPSIAYDTWTNITENDLKLTLLMQFTGTEVAN
jgi:hypothetical protein